MKIHASSPSAVPDYYILNPTHYFPSHSRCPNYPLLWTRFCQNWNMPTNVVILEGPDKILMSLGPFRQIFIVKFPNVSRSKEAVDCTYTT